MIFLLAVLPFIIAGAMRLLQRNRIKTKITIPAHAPLTGRADETRMRVSTIAWPGRIQ